ncbi:MAG: hypothetical protein EBZ77_16040, partial [Chitinophagia bacterium]|nr:hypothetical protein [Chitinophagia bacterium]
AASGPTPNIRKLKKWKELDADVVDSLPGTGELTGLTGALVCRFGNNEFSVGSGLTYDDRVRYTKCLPKRIKVRYLNLSDGVPLNPVFEHEL